MKKLLVAFLLCAILSSSIFAQGTKEQTSSEPKTLSVLWFNDANESDVFMDTMKDYLAANPNIKLDMQVIAFADYEQKLKLMISGGNPPDIARVTNNNVANLINSLEPIDSYVDNINSTKSQFMEGSIAFALNDNNELCAYPTEATANGMLVNLEAWDKAGIDVKTLSKTWTWDQWEEAVKKVIAANENIKYGLALDFSPHRFSTILYEMGGRMMNDDQSKVNFENQGTIDAINLIKKYHDEGLMPKSVWLGSENPAELFQAGLVACHIGGSWNINAYNQNVKDFKWCAVNTPKGVINSSVPGGKFIATFKDSKYKKEAMDVMAAFSDAEHNALYCANTFNLSSRVNANVPYATNSEDFKVFSEDLQKTPSYTALEWKNPTVNKVYSYIREQVVQVLMGNISAQQATINIDEQAASLE